MTTQLAVFDFIRRFDLRDAAARLRSAARALVGLGRWGSSRSEEPLALLSPPAKALLRQVLDREGEPLRVPAIAGAAIRLELADIISISREPGPASPHATFLLSVNPWARERLRHHPEWVA